MLRSLSRVIVLSAALLLAAPLASAQDDAQPLPKAPVPYTKLHPKKAPARKPAALTPASAQAAAGPATIAPASEALAAPIPTPPPPPPPGATPAPSAPVAHARLQPGQPIAAGELEAWVDGWMDEAMARAHVAGAAISVVQNGQVLLKKGYGFADLKAKKAVDPDRTLFRIGSISKTFTWILVMKEVERGRIHLDRPVNLYLPEKVRVRDDGQSRPVLVANLMDHSAGFEDRALGQLFERDPDRVRPLALYLRQERPARVREPGVLSSYSNYGAALAGEAVSFVSGKTFERRVDDEIAGPLGMTRTTFREPRDPRRGLPAPMAEALRPDVASGYRWTGAAFEPRGYEYVGQAAPAGSASSTAADMARYMFMLLGDGNWNGTAIFGPLQQTPPGINGWAHGFIVYSLPGGFKGYGHDGATVAFHSSMVVIPQLNLGVFITTNSDSGADLVGRFPDRLVRRFYAEPAIFPRPGSRELADRAEAYAGYYLSTRRAYSGLEGFVDLLISGVTVRVTPDGRLVTGGGGGGARAWVPEGPLADGRFVATLGDAHLAFHTVDGRAVAFRDALNAATLQRAPFLKHIDTLAVTAGLAALAALATLVGLVARNRRDLRESALQSRASMVQNMQAGLWLAAMVLFGLWAARATGDQAKALYGWPGPLIITASTCALVAAALTLLTVIGLPAVWRGGRRVESWSPLRKLAFTTTVVVYAAFSLILGIWGALAPWSG
jgi:CubicO group peptidase (beta-lactamase class C family)